MSQKNQDMVKIKEAYLEEEEHLIQQTPLSFCGAQDCLTWTMSTNGIYTIKKG